MSEKINQNFKVWSESPFDKDTKEETIKLKLNNIENFNDSFYKDLEFGTGGMRGIMGVGPNRVNKYTFGKNTQAISDIINLKREKSSVVIGHDCRNNSRELSLEVANIFSANNIKVFIFDSLKPTPLISYAVRQLDCICGIVLTASHNPPEYNGYKVYWEDGGQIVPPMDKEIIEKINKTDYSSIKFSPKNDLIKILDENIEEEFKKLSIKTARIGNSDRSKLKVVFTALHGTSFKLIPEILKSSGYSDVKLVEDQMIPDGNFTNVNSSNPEDINALEQAIILGKKYDSDIIIGTDPDADRFGIAVKNNNNEYVLINGNQAMVVMTDYLLCKENKLNDKFIASTVVSTPMMDKISRVFDERFWPNGGEDAYNLAYEDIKKAFEVYLKNYNKGKPIIIAGHSQGAGHLKRLLQEVFDGKEIENKLIAAYLIGTKVTEDDFFSLKLMNSENEIGGYVTWNTFKVLNNEDKYNLTVDRVWLNDAQVTNPITWNNFISKDYNDHKGFLWLNQKVFPNTIIIESIDEGINVKTSKMGFPKTLLFSAIKDYHKGDINLFWEDIRINAIKRTRKYFEINN